MLVARLILSLFRIIFLGPFELVWSGSTGIFLPFLLNYDSKKIPNVTFIYQPQFLSVFIGFNSKAFNLSFKGMLISTSKNFIVHINTKNNVKYHEETWV